MKYKIPYLLLIFTFMVFVFTIQASATIITFSDKATFLTATGATDATGSLPNLGLISGGANASTTVGSVTFSITPPSSQLYIGTLGISNVINNDWTLGLPGPDIAISDVENLNMGLSSPVYALGFDFVEPEKDPNLNAPFVDSTFTVTLKNNVVTVDSFTFNRPSDIAAFVGIWGDTAFDRVEIRETTGGIENEFFGQVYTGTTPVPEPGILILLGLSMVSIAGLRRWWKE